MNFNKIYKFLKLLIVNIVSILFLIGLTVVNIAMYIGFGLVFGLIATGLTLILIALIIDHESKERG
ncbi:MULTISPECIES: hypothetical protein [Staphylococcus]|uniref:hypothetical protein n=1 Tax=Staphylococcus TaxID=1279 RepID=UPI0007641C10|nr:MULTISPECIES: hypothetical protein [Staphylococcus]OFN23402.1 hypothetical protein HMPREF2603_09530 [Staphylococcus sp. HMSC055C03]KXA42119.1 hypothetical protein HMPREF3215_02219 [Staphylococcus simulans]OFM15721.1 hypothetical protein HMPREF2713_08930 [Staphylococcus sp. HMSC059E03]OFP20243.1 hypothetical protein HMPREF2997_11505 [Staphylococcus sp. HMSC057C08]OFV03228.1 hypothetical protein HMPREF3124_12405 [Staphylococcus sp. HMSC12H08]